MKTVTYEQFLKFNPCWLADKEQAKKLKRILTQKPAWTALDILALPDVSSKDKLWAVLREDFIDANTLHEFGCRVAEVALSRVKDPDPRSIAAIEAKRKWVKGEITDEKLEEANSASRSAARSATSSAAWFAASFAATAAASFAARSAARFAARDAARFAARDAATAAARAAAWSAESAASSAAWEEFAAMLVDMLENESGDKATIGLK